MDSTCTEDGVKELPPSAADNSLRMDSSTSVVLDPQLEVGVEAKSQKAPSSQYKGVVPQPNGRWGAQIYERNRRVWLGTFAEEVEAAHVYDIAAQRFRGRDAVTNFIPLLESGDDKNAAALELVFLAAHSKAEIVDMLRKHTYHDELQQSKRRGLGIGRRRTPSYSDESAREMLFEKAVTPSDVGKLNRLVIPKQHAEKHFPLRSTDEAACKGLLLNFEDAMGKVWRFRYSYWNSSQSYVLTRGWIRFVKEKSLRAGDVVSFWRSTEPEKQLYIDRRAGNGAAGAAEETDVRKSTWKAPVASQAVVRLFGVNISDVVPGGTGYNGKEEKEDDLFQQPFFPKRQRSYIYL